MRVAIFGIGNVLAHDDAAGPSVVCLLDAHWTFPEGVVVEDIGTPALELPTHLAGYDRVILVDAVEADAPAGTIRIYRREEILLHPPGLRLSPHDPALKETLMLLELTGEAPADLVLVGVVARVTEMGVGLSDEVRAALMPAAEAVVAQLAGMGLPPTRRETPRAPDLWWQAA